MQEKKMKKMIIAMQPSLYEKFKEGCEKDYKSISEVIRELIVNYIKNKENKNEQ